METYTIVTVTGYKGIWDSYERVESPTHIKILASQIFSENPRFVLLRVFDRHDNLVCQFSRV